jgi:hypothetical protein
MDRLVIYVLFQIVKIAMKLNVTLVMTISFCRVTHFVNHVMMHVKVHVKEQEQSIVMLVKQLDG